VRGEDGDDAHALKLENSRVSEREDPSFVPAGASRTLPFVIGTERAFRAPPWYARALLWLGLVEGFLRLRRRADATRHWKRMAEDEMSTFMREPATGAAHPSRRFVAELVGEGESVLDVGCGPALNYEVLAALGKASAYVGIDASESALAVARELYPAADFRPGDATRLTAQFAPRSFDVVMVRHVLEHLPAFEAAMAEAIAVSRRMAVFTFFLTPRRLPLRIPKVNLRYGRPPFLNVYAREAIDRFLAARDVEFTWHHGIGPSRAGWFADEVNSVLVVSRR
jgi:SAM-dependent methyltransferase